ncbi:cation:proton antiporter [Embleya sp. NBC_00888]|uniref:cation:proton antiporter domain-containing protein n=1 Tax=Embleya sp. NBC_00888 TaxID=2975960 RepID=UPI00386345B5|nr:cation:proton antiporter [Embleya sp. NBC_00888]
MFDSMATAAETKLAIMFAGIAVVLLTGVVFGRIARSLRQPIVIGEITAGIVLGPSLLGLFPGDLSQRLFPADVRPLLSAVSQVGLILFMFMVGWEFEKRLIRPHVGLAAAVSLTSVALSFGLGALSAVVLYQNHDVVDGRHISFTAFATFMGAAMSVTAFPVLARILSDNKLTDTRVGTLALASAAIDDVLAWCMLAYVSALVTSGGDTGDLIVIMVRSVVYVALMFVVVRPLLAAVTWRFAGREHWRTLLLILSAGALLSAWATTWIGIHAIFGAFLFGFVTPREPSHLLVEHVRKPLEQISLVLLPVFFIVTGLGVDIGGLAGTQYLELGLILLVACAGKLLGAVVPARVSGMAWREAVTLGLLMNTRGLTELIILNAAVSLGVLDGQIFTMMVIMALFTTALAGPLLPRGQAVEALRPEPRPVASGSQTTRPADRTLG